MRHVVERVDARKLDRKEIAVDRLVVIRRVWLLHGQAESDLVPVS